MIDHSVPRVINGRDPSKGAVGVDDKERRWKLERPDPLDEDSGDSCSCKTGGHYEVQAWRRQVGFGCRVV